MSKLFGEIYKITNKINGKIYIGKAQVSYYGIPPSLRRFKEHISRALGDQKDCPHLARAIKFYGPENFVLTILDKNYGNAKSLCKMEEFYGNKYSQCYDRKTGYNLAKCGRYDAHFGKRISMGGIDGKTRACTKCKIVKPIDDFYKHSMNGVDGRKPQCKICIKEYDSSRKEHNKKVRNKDPDMKKFRDKRCNLYNSIRKKRNIKDSTIQSFIELYTKLKNENKNPYISDIVRDYISKI